MTQNKITLISPPDIFENNNTSILFMHLTDEEQDIVSKWLNAHLQNDVNIYIYSGEDNINWIFYALSCSEHKYINIDCVNHITQALSGYILSKNDVYYKTTDLANIYNHISTKRVDNIEQFLESILSGQTTNPNNESLM